MKLIVWVALLASIAFAAWHYGPTALHDLQSKDGKSSQYTPCMINDYLAC